MYQRAKSTVLAAFPDAAGALAMWLLSAPQHVPGVVEWLRENVFPNDDPEHVRLDVRLTGELAVACR